MVIRNSLCNIAGNCPESPADVSNLGAQYLHRLGLAKAKKSHAISRINSLHVPNAFGTFIAHNPVLKYRRFEEQIGWFIMHGVPHFTEWMREPEIIRTLREAILPEWKKRSFTIASLGCSSGEEVYSILLSTADSPVSVKVTGYDIDPASISIAKSGCYPCAGEPLHNTQLGNVPAQFQDTTLVSPVIIDKFIRTQCMLDPSRQLYMQIDMQLKKQANFKEFDFLLNPVDGKYDLLMLCHVLRHFNSNSRKRILQHAALALDIGGLLACESSLYEDKEITQQIIDAGFNKVRPKVKGWWGGLQDIGDISSIYQKSC